MWQVPSARSDDSNTKSAGNVSSLATRTMSPTCTNQQKKTQPKRESSQDVILINSSKTYFILLDSNGSWVKVKLNFKNLWNPRNVFWVISSLPWCFWILSEPDFHCGRQKLERHSLHCQPCVSASPRSPWAHSAERHFKRRTLATSVALVMIWKMQSWFINFQTSGRLHWRAEGVQNVSGVIRS